MTVTVLKYRQTHTHTQTDKLSQSSADLTSTYPVGHMHGFLQNYYQITSTFLHIFIHNIVKKICSFSTRLNFMTPNYIL